MSGRVCEIGCGKVTGPTINRFRVAQAMNATSAKSAIEHAIKIRNFMTFVTSNLITAGVATELSYFHTIELPTTRNRLIIQRLGPD